VLCGFWSVPRVGAQRWQRALRGAVPRLTLTRGGFSGREVQDGAVGTGAGPVDRRHAPVGGGPAEEVKGVFHRRAAETQRRPRRSQRALRVLERSSGWRAEMAESAEGSRSPAHVDAGRIFGASREVLRRDACLPKWRRKVNPTSTNPATAASTARLSALCSLCAPTRGTLRSRQDTLGFSLVFLCVSVSLR
jgi:hypothetical protein